MLPLQQLPISAGAPQAPVRAARAWHRCASGHHPKIQLPIHNTHDSHRRDRATERRSCSPSVLTLQDTKVDEQQAGAPDMADRHIAVNEAAGSLSNLLSLEYQSRSAPLLLHWDQDHNQPRRGVQDTQQLHSVSSIHGATGRPADWSSMQPLHGSISLKQRQQSSPEPCLQQNTAGATSEPGSALVSSTLARGVRRSPSRQLDRDVINSWPAGAIAKPSYLRRQRAMSLGPSLIGVPAGRQQQTRVEHASRAKSAARGSSSSIDDPAVSASNSSQTAMDIPLQPRIRQPAGDLPSIRSVIKAVHARIKKVPYTVLTRQEEHVLALWCKDWVALMAVRARLRHILLRGRTAEEMARALNMDAFELRVRMAMGHSAKDLLVACNKGLVLKIAQQVYFKQQSKGRRPSMPDLMLEGTRGLLNAIQKFEPDRGLKLSTYAVPWILQYATRVVGREGYVLDVPSHIQDKMMRLGTVNLQLTNQLQRTPTDDELLPALGWSAERLQEVRTACYTSTAASSPVAIDSSTNDDEGSMTLAESLSTSEQQDDEGNSVSSTAEVGVFDGNGHMMRNELAQLLSDAMVALANQEASVNQSGTQGEAHRILNTTMELLWTACTGTIPKTFTVRATHMLDSKSTLCAALAALKLVRKGGFQPPDDSWLKSQATELGVQARHVRMSEVKLIALLHNRFGADLAVLLQDLQQPAAGVSPGNAAPRSTAGAFKKSK